MPDETPATPDPRNDELAEEMVGLLRRLIERYEQLRSLADLRMEAIRSADGARLGACIGQENELVQQVAELEKRRLELVGELSSRVGAPPDGRATVAWVASRVGRDAGRRLSAAAAALRELLSGVRKRNESARAAAEALSNHMTGLIKTLTEHLNHAKTYGRAGTMDAGPRIVSSVDLGA